MKRDRSDYEEEPMKHIVESLMMLSQSFDNINQIDVNQSTRSKLTNHTHFECKTCNKKFDSFQALGGHRASHKKPKVKLCNNENVMHKCLICDHMFMTGQALGGHMRKHRVSLITEKPVYSKPVLNRCNGNKMVLDLNLTPLENDLIFIFGKNLVPQIDLNFVN